MRALIKTYVHTQDTRKDKEEGRTNSKKEGREPRAFKTGADCKRITGTHGKKYLAEKQYCNIKPLDGVRGVW